MTWIEDELLFETIIKKQNTESTDMIITILENNPQFLSLAEIEMQNIIQRDREDEEKLQQGIDLAIRRGIINPLAEVHDPLDISAEEKKPGEIVREILSTIPDPDNGKLIRIMGRSGTGKGTVAKVLLEQIPGSLTWSNGDAFRLLTLAVTEQLGNRISGSQLSHALIEQCMETISLEISRGSYNLKISLPSGTFPLEDIRNTLLKEQRIAVNIPTVAEMSQGEIIQLTRKALRYLTDAGTTVVLEGRKATLDFFPGPYFYNIVLNDPVLIGERRVAQKLLSFLNDCEENCSWETRLKSALQDYR